MSIYHTLSIEYQIKQSRRCKNLSAQNRKLFNSLEKLKILLKLDLAREEIIKEIDTILKENKPL
jgi:hypothetical protein